MEVRVLRWAAYTVDRWSNNEASYPQGKSIHAYKPKGGECRDSKRLYVRGYNGGTLTVQTSITTKTVDLWDSGQLFNQQGDRKMTANEFNQLCQSHLVDPEIALDNENIIEALQVRGTHQQIFEKVEQVLITEF